MPKTIAIDFDGTLCENDFPRIGQQKLKVIEAVKKARREGNSVVLWTCREGSLLDKALEWCGKYGLEFDAVNENTKELRAAYGNDPRKLGAFYFVDDRALRPEEFVEMLGVTNADVTIPHTITRGRITRKKPHG